MPSPAATDTTIPALPRISRLAALLKALTFLGMGFLVPILIDGVLARLHLLHLMRGPPVITPWLIAQNDIPLLIAALAGAAITLPHGGRNIAGFLEASALAGPPVRAVGGILTGAVAVGILTLLLISASALHVRAAPFDPVSLLLYIPAFLLVGAAEELAFRGALLFWLARAIGFYPALMLASALFGLVHWLGGDPAWGAASTALIGWYFALTLRATGALWFAIGFHAIWDYGLSAVLGCRDSGIPSRGALLDSVTQGPAWLSGGDAGPEGSVLCFMLVGLLCAMVWRGMSRRSNPRLVIEAPDA